LGDVAVPLADDHERRGVRTRPELLLERAKLGVPADRGAVNVGDQRLELPRSYDRGQGEQVLLVEDDTTARQAMQEILQALNYRVFASGSGAEALQEYDRRGGEIDLVLSDIVMPDKGGVELYRALQAINPAVKIVLMTGYPTGQGTRELLDQRQVTWLQKPFTTEALGKTLRQMLQR